MLQICSEVLINFTLNAPISIHFTLFFKLDEISNLTRTFSKRDVFYCEVCLCLLSLSRQATIYLNAKWCFAIHSGDRSKCFTDVTKTCANLTTYSRKPENYNGTIIFEIDIMKNSSPINLNLCQTWLFHNCFGCFFCFDLRWAESAVSPAEKKCYFGFHSGRKCEF